MPADKIAVSIEPRKLVPITDNEGGYLGGRCLLCDSGGWSNGPDSLGIHALGVPHGKVVSGLTNQLIHKEDCPVGKWLLEKYYARS